MQELRGRGLENNPASSSGSTATQPPKDCLARSTVPDLLDDATFQELTHSLKLDACYRPQVPAPVSLKQFCFHRFAALCRQWALGSGATAVITPAGVLVMLQTFQ